MDGNKPVLFKGLAKRSPAYELFTDDYLKSFDGAGSEVVYAEPEKKENRTKKGFDMSFKAFVERYHKETLYMVNALPSALRCLLSLFCCYGNLCNGKSVFFLKK